VQPLENGRKYAASFLLSQAPSKNGGKSHDKADVGRRKIASTAMRARGSAHVCVMCAYVRAYVMRAAGVRFSQRNDDDSNDDFVEGTGKMKKMRERERAKARERERERGGREGKRERERMRRWQGESLSCCAIEKFYLISKVAQADACTGL